ncbi:hypothetical protein E4U60_003210 [Claviceps pazoutovae]|uniref:Uncharacterized protein n=1 Tax=Claviceps pazoutovae TaxID=1649127 RepID=A0A9P7SKA9_9HYPO|nr:hypothetical protein E4U60_003210 [Claviceps pazoutovae]
MLIDLAERIYEKEAGLDVATLKEELKEGSLQRERMSRRNCNWVADGPYLAIELAPLAWWHGMVPKRQQMEVGSHRKRGLAAECESGQLMKHEDSQTQARGTFAMQLAALQILSRK